MGKKPLIPTDALEVRIRCCYCNIRETCKAKMRKQMHESAGVITKCIITPNRPKKKSRLRG